ncbi:MAG: glycosyltransferase [Phreatobacter sp.]|uniref:glycosyltransferase n=1 Tax=Phreatobacter sp. TaxID=1966341 RepID=UPI001A3C9080|nr:glycosyltransferase [Phreatobacter sp.]MBL8571955.1 glycosyltransferase [Phreatobacter sp.]
MKVLHLSTSDAGGGAAIAASRLCHALRGAGAEALMLSRWSAAPSTLSLNSVSDVDDAIALGEALQDGYIDSRRSDLSDTLFSLETFRLPLRAAVERHQPDVIHLHWVARFLSSADLIALGELGRPIVWTLHDMWPFTGGCHYSAGCRGFATDCDACPQLQADPARAVSIQLASRAEAVAALGSRLVCVCPSRWLAQTARSSLPLRTTAIEVIANGVDTAVFSPEQQARVRRRLGLDLSGGYIGFGAADLRERRKGFGELKAALEQASANRPQGRSPIGMVCFGHFADDIQVDGVQVIRLGALTSEAQLADAYRAVDAFALTSLEDNQPNTGIEAAACGTPLIGYRAGGIPEIVIDGSTGLLVDVGDRMGLADIIARVADDEALRVKLGIAARDDAYRRFSLPRLADDHLALYERLLRRGSSMPKKVAVALPGLAPGVAEVALPAAFVRTSRELRRTTTELAAAIEWGRSSDKLTAAERKRAGDAEAWANQAEATLEQQRALEHSLRHWIQQSEETVAKARAEALEFKSWAERTEALLAEARREAQQAYEWARRSDEQHGRDQALLAELRQWNEDAERRVAAVQAVAGENCAWAERTEALLQQSRVDTEQAREWARQADEERERGKELHAQLVLWAENAEKKATAAQRLAAENQGWAERTEAMLTSARAEAEANLAWARRADAVCERLGAMADSLERNVATVSAGLENVERQLAQARDRMARLEAEIEPLRRFAKTYRWVYVLHHGKDKA